MDDAKIERTRRSLHVVAESLMAGPQYRASGTIRLYLTPSGFETRAEPRLRVDGNHLLRDGERFELCSIKLAELADSVGVEPGAPGNYHDGAHGEPDEVIEVDSVVAQWLFGALNIGQQGLKIFAPSQDPVLWPEHFDVGILLDDIAYGVSPGDRHIGEPYVYVSATAPDADPYWNESFGAARTVGELESAEAIREFFDEGRRRLDRR